MKNRFHKMLSGSMALAILFALVFLAQNANATTVFINSGNANPMVAVPIPPNSSTWNFYGKFNSSYGAQYFSIFLKSGQVVDVALVVPSERMNIYPHLAILGPSLSQVPDTISNLQSPFGYSATELINTPTPNLTYNPLIPSATYVLSSVSFTSYENATYYFVVFGAQKNTTYEFSSSAPTMSVADWIALSVQSLGIYNWEKEPLGFVLLPLIITFLLGNILVFKMYWKDKNRLNSYAFWTGIFSGIFLLGSADTLLMQVIVDISITKTLFGVIISLALVAIAASLGAYALLITTRMHSEQNRLQENRKKLIAIGILGLVASVGFAIGPLLAIFSGIIASSSKKNASAGSRTLQNMPIKNRLIKNRSLRARKIAAKRKR